jgi:hypothetical protein
MSNNDFYIQKYNDDIWNKNPALREYINRNLSDATVLERNKVKQASGNILSTVDLINFDERWLLVSPELQPVIAWVKTQMKKVADAEDYMHNKKIQWRRIWVNKMLNNSSVIPHVHDFDGLVGVYYLYMPKNSAQLKIKDQQLKCQTGDLVIHKSNIIHSVSEHLAEEPRISIIFEAIFVE